MKYGCYLTEADVDLGAMCPIDNPNEVTINDCEDCPYSKEVDEVTIEATR